jgi:hypothetical protein
MEYIYLYSEIYTVWQLRNKISKWPQNMHTFHRIGLNGDQASQRSLHRKVKGIEQERDPVRERQNDINQIWVAVVTLP